MKSPVANTPDVQRLVICAGLMSVAPETKFVQIPPLSPSRYQQEFLVLKENADQWKKVFDETNNQFGKLQVGTTGSPTFILFSFNKPQLCGPMCTGRVSRFCGKKEGRGPSQVAFTCHRQLRLSVQGYACVLWEFQNLIVWLRIG